MDRLTAPHVLIAGMAILLVLAGHAAYWVVRERAVRRRERKAAAAQKAALEAAKALIRPRVAGELAVNTKAWAEFVAKDAELADLEQEVGNPWL